MLNPQWGKYASSGFEVMAGVALGLGVGYWLDSKFDWSPWGTLVGGIVGIFAGLYLFIKEALKMNKD
jgi:F0F1-type ATP synthase assembly protein I